MCDCMSTTVEAVQLERVGACRINHPHGWIKHGVDQVEASQHKLDAGTKQRGVLQSGSSDLTDKSPRIMVMSSCFWGRLSLCM